MLSATERSAPGRHTVLPLIDRMTVRALKIGIQILPPDFNFCLKVDEHNIGDASITPGITSNASMAIVVVERCLLSPFVRPIYPDGLIELARCCSVP